MNLKQKELAAWEVKNFPRSRYENMTKEQLIDIILILQTTIGIAEEVGEVCHAILKGVQGIREGVGGIRKDLVADGVGDAVVYSTQLLTKIGVDAEAEIEKTINTVLDRDWTNNPHSG